jgi:lysophospholipase L1-like esterase
VGVVYSETKLARRRIKPREEPPPVADGVWTAAGASARKPVLHIAVMGDSSAAGYGLDDASETPAAVLANGLSALSGRPVDVVCTAVVGAQSSGLGEQVEHVLAAATAPELAYIMIGANDVTHRIRSAESVRHLAAATTALREAGCAVVVGTCPDLGTIRPIAQPLRFLARRLSRTLAAAQTIAVVEAGGRTVSLGDVLGPRFAVEHDLFGADLFHPSARGYAAAIEVALPSAAAALGLPTQTASAGPFLTQRVRPIAQAAARAAAHPGTEVAAAQLDGSDRGNRGRWARLLRRTPDRAAAQPSTATATARSSAG